MIQLLTLRPTPTSSTQLPKALLRATLHPAIYNLFLLSTSNNLLEISCADVQNAKSVIVVGWLGGQGLEQCGIQVGKSVIELLGSGSGYGMKVKVCRYTAPVG